jgi:acetylornithine deacetylase
MRNTVETLAILAGFPTISADSNEALIRYAAQRITAAGGRIHTLQGAVPGKFNLLAQFGPATGAGIVLSGHSDVVPVAGQNWHSDPFTLSERDGRLYARGASDMKGFLAAMLTAAERCAAENLARPLYLAFSYDEEIGCVGVRDLLARLGAENFQAQGCIIGEPTELRVALGHKGKIAGCVCCRGRAAHSANPSLGCNAINLASGMVQEMQAVQDFLSAHGARDAAYPFACSSVHVGTIKGGTALNIVPDACDLAFEIRYLPGEDVTALLDRLRDAAAKLSAASNGGAIELQITNAYPGLETGAKTPIAQLALAAAATEAAKIGFGTEGGLFRETLGMETVVCGPGSIDRAHKPDEYVTRAELDTCDAFLDRVIATLA